MLKSSKGREGSIKHFFVSYNIADRQWAEWIAWQLEEAGYTTVLQAWDFRPGTNFVLEMQRAARGTERTIAVLSQAYLDALYTQSEWAAAFGRDPTGEKGTLLPMRVRECDLEGLLPQIIYVDLVGLSEAEAKDALLAGVRRERAKPTIPPRFPAAASRSVSEQPRFPGGVPHSTERAVWSRSQFGIILILLALVIAFYSSIPNIVRLVEGPQVQTPVMSSTTTLSTNTPIPLIAMPASPTKTPVPLTDTPMPKPTHTPMPPTDTLMHTAVSPTPTPMPTPTDTVGPPVPTPTNTLLPPMPTATRMPTDTSVPPTPRPKPIIYSFTADRYTIVAGESVVLRWDLAGANVAYLRYNGIEEGVVAPGAKTVFPVNTTVYTLVARNDVGETTAQLTITVNPPTPTVTPIPPTPTPTLTPTLKPTLQPTPQPPGPPPPTDTPALPTPTLTPTTPPIQILSVYVESGNNLRVVIDGICQRYRLYVRRVGATFGDAPHYEYYQIYESGICPKDLLVVVDVNPNTIYCAEIKSDDGLVRHDISSYLTGSGSKPYIGGIYVDGSCPID